MAFKSLFSKRKDRKKGGALPSTQREREEREADRLIRAEARHDPNSKLNIAMPYIVITLAVFLGLCLYTSGGGLVGSGLRFLFLSLFLLLIFLLSFLLLFWFLLHFFHFFHVKLIV